MEEENLEEYKMLRDEMQNCIERDNTLTTFMVTAVATILTFAISANLQVPFLFLISFCIIIPFTARIAHYKGNVARISAYIIVFLETEMNTKYETRNILAKPEKTKKSKLLISMRNYIGFWLGLISYAVYVAEYINNIGIQGFWNIVFCITPVVLLILTIFLDKKIDSLPKERKRWIETWENLKKEQKEKGI